jgi:L-ascorbate metabolism protein UlaG (beta-lactamase superfamily)
MAVAITDGRATVMTDFPYESGYSGYMTYEASEIRSATPSTIALITHRHRDHWEPTLFGRTDWKVFGPRDVIEAVPAGRRFDVRSDAPTGFHIEQIETPHANVQHWSYVVTWHGRRLYFTGDTESLDALLAARNLDVAFVSPWLYRAAVRRAARIDARRVMIYHHAQGERVPDCTGSCSVPRQGDTLRF